MARQAGIIKIKGTVGGLTFYKSQDGLLVREKGGVEAERIKNDPAFQRTRENGAEFGRAGSAGKILRSAFRMLLQRASDSRVTSRLTQQMMKVVKADATSERGQRNVIDGEVELLQDFEFNINGKLQSTLFAPYTVTINRATGAHLIDLLSFDPAVSIAFPSGATHCKIMAGAASIDFENATFEFNSATSLPIDLGPSNGTAVNLPVALQAGSTNPILLVLGIEFFQEVNGQMYTLKNGAYNALAIVAVNSGV